MSSHDVRDMLNLPSASSAPRPAKKQKVAGPRPKITGLARELQMLGGDNPIAIIQDQAPRGKKRAAGRSNSPAKQWILKPFTNPARDDVLILKHWQLKDQIRQEIADNLEGEKAPHEVDQLPQIGESGFAKFNVRTEKLKYTDQEYDSLLQSDEWTREETDYLVDIVTDYDMRWPIIVDRYEYVLNAPQHFGEGDSEEVVAGPKVRDLEELKARYYEISARMLEHRRPVQSMNEAEYKLREAYRAFDADIERRRKEYAAAIMRRSKEEAKEEEHLLAEIRRIIARQERFNEERNELYARLDAPVTPSNTNIAMFTQSAALQSLVAQLADADRKRKRKSLASGEAMSPSINGQHTNGLDRRDSSRQDSLSGQGSTGRKGGSGAERRKLTEEEERIYGVTHHDRLSHGTLLRSDKAHKAVISKSVTHAAKISNTLTELGLKTRPTMPTQRVIAEFQTLIERINLLLDARKINDKLDAEIMLEKRKKIEREEREKQQREAEFGGGEQHLDGTPAQDRAPKFEQGEGADSSRANSIMHKRSASVISAVSEGGTKRQKK